VPSIAPDVHSSYHPNELNLGMFLANFVELAFCELRLYLMLGSSLFTLRRLRLAQFVATVYDSPLRNGVGGAHLSSPAG
jgi:hypothetical protein